MEPNSTPMMLDTNRTTSSAVTNTATTAAITTATPSRRQSCDRCHAQKLRCTRSGNSKTGACNRCLRQGAQCVYSFSLPKGRPCTSHSAEEHCMPTRDAASPASPHLSRRLSTMTTNDPDYDAANGESKADPMPEGMNLSTGTPQIANSEFPEDIIMNVPSDSLSAVWQQKDLFNWNDPLCNGGEQDPSEWLNLSSLAAATHLDMHATLPDGIGSPSNFNFNGGNIADAMIADTLSCYSSGGFPEPKARDLNAGIAQLSNLSTHLNSLHRSSCALTEALASSKHLENWEVTRSMMFVISDSAFKGVATWLTTTSNNMKLCFGAKLPTPGVGTTTIGDILSDGFATSAQLVEIIRSLQGEPGFTFGITNPSSASSSSGPVESAVFMGLPKTHFNDRASLTSQYSNSVVHHLVIACHTLLLSTYVTILGALQKDISLRGPTSFGSTDKHVGTDAGPRGHMRIVVIVHLCSYLVRQQCHEVDAYLASNSTPNTSKFPDGSIPQPPASPADRAEMLELRLEVQHRITWLQQSLHM